MAMQTVPGYIVVPSEKLLIKVNSDGTSDVVLSGKDYEQWQAHANQARQDRDGVQR
jgi:cobyric acid synthase